MNRINLLPWREELREEKKKACLSALLLVIILAVGLLLVADRHFKSTINQQQQRNRYLHEQIVILDERLAEIRELQAQKAALSERMSVIQDLQGNRPIIVRLFDEMARGLPAGVFYEAVSRNGDHIMLDGYAESASKVSTLMRNLEHSVWFSNPVLQQVSALTGTQSGIQSGAPLRAGYQRFLLTVAITRPEQTQSHEIDY